MEKFFVDGIVIKAGVTGEADRIVTVLTRNRGLIHAFAKGARSTKNRLHASTSLFAYCNFYFYQNKGVYSITEAEVKDVFFGLRVNLESMTLAQYFCEIALKTVPGEVSDGEPLRLMLNSLHFICNESKPLLLIKSVFELRTAGIAGYMPAIVACDSCGEYETDMMYFDCQGGKLFCSDCGKGLNLPRLPKSVVAAMRHVLFSDFSKIFSFSLADESLFLLSRITQRYIENCFQQSFKLLSYFNAAFAAGQNNDDKNTLQ